MSLPIKLALTEIKNVTQMTLGSLTVFYFYQTPIAYHEHKKLTAIDGGVLTPMTKRHIHALEPDFNARIAHSEFLEKLKAAMTTACVEIARGRSA
jgi:hypothetical protein